MAPKILPLMPMHTVYVEPFAGGAAVLFAKPWPNVSNNNHYREVINDTDSRLVNFYRVLREQPDALARVLELTPCSREEHALARPIDAADGVERARQYFVQANQSFANKLGGGWGTSVFARNKAATWANCVARLGEVADRFRSVHVEHADAIEVIRRWDSPQTFFYCDPPYPGAHQGHYSGYTSDDFARLVSALGECHGSFLLSNYAQPGVPDEWERFEFSAVASASGKGTSGKGRDKTRAATEHSEGKRRTEVVWRRFNTVRPREEIVKLYESGAFDCFPGGYFDGERVRSPGNRPTGGMFGAGAAE